MAEWLTRTELILGAEGPLKIGIADISLTTDCTPARNFHQVLMKSSNTPNNSIP